MLTSTIGAKTAVSRALTHIHVLAFQQEEYGMENLFKLNYRGTYVLKNSRSHHDVIILLKSQRASFSVHIFALGTSVTNGGIGNGAKKSRETSVGNLALAGWETPFIRACVTEAVQVYPSVYRLFSQKWLACVGF